MNPKDVGTLLVKAASLLREVSKERDLYRQKTASLEMERRLSKIASEMKHKGINTHMSEDELMSDLAKKAAEGRLDAIEQALNWSSGGDSNFTGFYKVAGENATTPSSVSGANMTNFVLTGESE